MHLCWGSEEAVAVEMKFEIRDGRISWPARCASLPLAASVNARGLEFLPDSRMQTADQSGEKGPVKDRFARGGIDMDPLTGAFVPSELREEEIRLKGSAGEAWHDSRRCDCTTTLLLGKVEGLFVFEPGSLASISRASERLQSTLLQNKRKRLLRLEPLRRI